MIEAVRRAAAAAALAVVLSVGVATSAFAGSPSPTPTATASATASKSATGSPTSAVTGDSGSASDTPDLAPDNSRTVQAVLVAGSVSLLAALVVFLRRR